MLLSLTIDNYALISHSRIDFLNISDKGFTAVTGESGAGKSILMGALSAVTGSKTDTSVIKQGEKKSIVEAEFDISSFNLRDFFEQNSLDYADITVLRREISDNGKSRAFINDSPVSLNILKETASFLVDVHSQNENLDLIKQDFQLGFVDAYAANSNIKNDYLSLFNDYFSLRSKINQLKDEAEILRKQSDFIKYAFAELDNAHLLENEQADLESELDELAHNEEIKTALETADNLLSLSEETNVAAQIKESYLALKKIENWYPKVADAVNRLDSAYIELTDIARDIHNLDRDTEYSPQRMDFINDRLQLIYNLEKKNSISSYSELLDLREQLRIKVDAVDNSAGEISDLEKELEKKRKELDIKAKDLHKSRIAVADDISAEIENLLSALAIKDAIFKIEFSRLPDFTQQGVDNVKFLFSANKNFAPQYLEKTASGGEISRLMLCLQYILSRSASLPTIVFDEIDTGISGDAAGKTAAMFEKMAENMQVICITHLPQVAAKAGMHLKVYKIEENGIVQSKVKELSDDERVNEIAVMLSGETVSQAAVLNAKQLLLN